LVHSKNGQGWLTMFTRSAGQSYDHPLVAVHNTDLRLDYGWYSHVSSDVWSTDLEIVAISSPKTTKKQDAHFFSRSVQANWVVSQLDDLIKLASTVKVIPVHRDRFLTKCIDLGELKRCFGEGGQRDVASLLRRTHDFSKGNVRICLGFRLGLWIPGRGVHELCFIPGF
jgi:hypothetical protein